MAEISRKHFSFDDLRRLQSLEGKQLSDVIYFVWVNRIQKDAPLVFIDKLQLKFSDGSVVTLTAGDDSDALHFVDDFDPAAEALQLDKDFQGKIILKPHNSSNDRFWSGIMNKTIRSVILSKDGSQYLADAVVLDFGDDRRLIGVSPEEGILIDFFEE